MDVSNSSALATMAAAEHVNPAPSGTWTGFVGRFTHASSPHLIDLVLDYPVDHDHHPDPSIFSVLS
jgi:hypothetical protein